MSISDTDKTVKRNAQGFGREFSDKSNMNQHRDRRNPMLLRKNIERIEKQRTPSSSDLKRLKVLKRELEELDASQAQFRDQNRPYNQRRSVFYDPEINPQGNAPIGWKQVYVDDIDSEYETDESVKDIRLPPRRDQKDADSRHGRSGGKAEAQITYESEEVLRDFDKEAVSFVPRALKTASIPQAVPQVVPQTVSQTVQPALKESEGSVSTQQPKLEDVSSQDEESDFEM